jgi:hypothetical protein
MMKCLTVGAASYWRRGTYVMSSGRIQFEYKGRVVSIGGTIDEDEAFEIVHRIQRRITPQAIKP